MVTTHRRWSRCVFGALSRGIAPDFTTTKHFGRAARGRSPMALDASLQDHDIRFHEWEGAMSDIVTTPRADGLPTLDDYQAAGDSFSWDMARRLVDGLPDGAGLNIAYEAVDRNVHQGRGATVALRCIDRTGVCRDVTYSSLRESTARFANVLEGLGIARGDVVFGLLPRTSDVHVAMLGTLKRGAVYSPLFAAFGPEPIRQRLELGRARAIGVKASCATGP
jgi:acetyl-CoA synthetase